MPPSRDAQKPGRRQRSAPKARPVGRRHRCAPRGALRRLRNRCAPRAQCLCCASRRARLRWQAAASLCLPTSARLAGPVPLNRISPSSMPAAPDARAHISRSAAPRGKPPRVDRGGRSPQRRSRLNGRPRKRLPLCQFPPRVARRLGSRSDREFQAWPPRARGGTLARTWKGEVEGKGAHCRRQAMRATALHPLRPKGYGHTSTGRTRRRRR